MALAIRCIHNLGPNEEDTTVMVSTHPPKHSVINNFVVFFISLIGIYLFFFFFCKVYK